jgi:PBSX family phage terminase large subunit
VRRQKVAAFKFHPFSKKQLKVLTWWCPSSPHKNKFALICDGSVRAGKTVVMSLSFVMWAMETFNGENLGMAGKTIGALRRNVIQPLKRMLKGRGYKVKDHRADNFLTIMFRGKTNYFYLFGGKDESSQDLIQGITLAGMFFDEVALMPKSFVNQATARCSVTGAKLWFNCNPAGPRHWFKTDWLDQLAKKNALHLHFTMEDNPSLDEETKKRYYSMYSGVFYKRFILGLWVVAEGLVYEDYNEEKHKVSREQINKMIEEGAFMEYIAGTDWGVTSPMAGNIYGVTREFKFYQIAEYYRRRSTTEDLGRWYLQQEQRLGRKINVIYCDSAEPDRILTLKKMGLRAIEAVKEIDAGLNTVMTLFKNDRLFICAEDCPNTENELLSYHYPEPDDPKAAADKPVDEDNHSMDAKRYCLHTYLRKRRV